VSSPSRSPLVFSSLLVAAAEAREIAAERELHFARIEPAADVGVGLDHLHDARPVGELELVGDGARRVHGEGDRCQSCRDALRELVVVDGPAGALGRDQLARGVHLERERDGAAAGLLTRELVGTALVDRGMRRADPLDGRRVGRRPDDGRVPRKRLADSNELPVSARRNVGERPRWWSLRRRTGTAHDDGGEHCQRSTRPHAHARTISRRYGPKIPGIVVEQLGQRPPAIRWLLQAQSRRSINVSAQPGHRVCERSGTASPELPT